MNSSPNNEKQQLLNVIERLRTQMKEMQELFEGQDEEKLQEIQSLLKERKELKEKIELLETKISNNDNLSSSLASTISSNPSIFEHETTTITDSGCCGGSHGLNDSLEMMYVEDYEKLQEKHQLLLEEKTYLAAKVDEMTSCLRHFQETAEELQQKNEEQEELIQRLVGENQRLIFTNKDLFKALSEQPKNDSSEVAAAAVKPKSLLEELQEAGVMEESFSCEPDVEDAAVQTDEVFEAVPANEILEDAAVQTDEVFEAPSVPANEILEDATAVPAEEIYGDAVVPVEEVSKDAAEDDKKQVKLCQEKKPPPHLLETSEPKSLFNELQGLLLVFFAISLYIFVCIYSGLPILHFISPSSFHYSRTTHGQVPM